ncbi:hypothetical protein ACIQTT_11795 [Microbacterium sp. NPDC090225]|uniref:hypothetical protein n=1 Tax=Microbacterium sp. NPDC090225 TaxID=3364207 RepID=UPI003825666C
MNVTTANAARAQAARRRHEQARRVVSTVSVVSLGLATVIAILLVADIRGAAAAGLAAATVVTLSIGCFAAALFGNLALLGHRAQAIGALGAAVTVATAAHTIWMIWAFFNAPTAFAAQSPLLWGGILATFVLAIGATLSRHTTSVTSPHSTAHPAAESRAA